MNSGNNSKSSKIRADKLLVDKGYFESRTQAQSSILAGRVRIGKDQVVKTAGERWPSTTDFTVFAPFPFAGRGALKLIPALEKYLPNMLGGIALDLGASTGGFTDALLHRGVSKVYAVDVGYGQLHYRLRKDFRVICLEKTNARYLSEKEVPERIDVLTADLSFISLTKVLPVTHRFLKPDSWIFILIKPQFEAKRHEVAKGGIVKSLAVKNRVIEEICEFSGKNMGWKAIEIMPAAIKGAKGNQEFLGVFQCRE